MGTKKGDPWAALAEVLCGAVLTRAPPSEGRGSCEHAGIRRTPTRTHRRGNVDVNELCVRGGVHTVLLPASARVTHAPDICKQICGTLAPRLTHAQPERQKCTRSGRRRNRVGGRVRS